MKQRILMASELGGGYGHIGRLLKIAVVLDAAGYEPVFAVPNLLETYAYYQKFDFAFLQSPKIPTRTERKNFISRTFLDILGSHQFADEQTVEPIVKAWETLGLQLSIDAVITDFAPFAQLAFYPHLPMAVVGTGFTVLPPHITEFPVLWPDAQACFTHEQILESANKNLQKRLQKPIGSIGNLYEGLRVVDCLPALDPYHSQRAENDNKLLFKPALPDLNEQKGKNTGQPAIYIYMPARHPFLPFIIESVSALSVTVAAHIRGASQTLKNKLKANGIKIYESPPAYEEALKDKDLLIHHGGLATCQAGLLNAVKQIIFPTDVEKIINARAVKAAGYGTYILENKHKNLIRETIMEMANDAAAQTNCCNTSRKTIEELQNKNEWGIDKIYNYLRTISK